MTSTERRIAACEADIAELRTALAKLQADGAPAAPAPPARPMPPPIRQDEGATIRTEAPGARFIMPTEPDLRSLFRIVLAAAPVLRSEPSRFESEDAPFLRFVDAFRALGAIQRLAKLDDGKSISWWIDASKDILSIQGNGGDMDARAFTVAVLAHGDIAYRALDTFPYDLAFGLAAHGRAVAGDAWRRVLESGKVARAAPAPNLRAVYPLPPVTIHHP